MAANVGNGSVCFVVVFVFLNYLEPKLCWFDQEKWRDRSQVCTLVKEREDLFDIFKSC